MNCYSNKTVEQLQASIAGVLAAPRRKWLKVGPHAGYPPAWREAVLMLQAIGDKVGQPQTWAQAEAHLRANIATANAVHDKANG